MTDASAESTAATYVHPRRPTAANLPAGPPITSVASAAGSSPRLGEIRRVGTSTVASLTRQHAAGAGPAADHFADCGSAGVLPPPGVIGGGVIGSVGRVGDGFVVGAMGVVGVGVVGVGVVVEDGV